MSVFALVDCNSFYASCEQAFNPALWGKPVVVLSNNDGNIIARSKEAKALGVGMGEPFFMERKKIEEYGVHVFSSNYALYGDMSNRVRKVFARFTPRIEFYSIDECFLDLSGFDPATLTDYCRTLKKTVERATRIPVCVGVGPTKSLAKIANKVAKKSAKAGGVVNLSNSPFTDKALESVPVGDIWGVGGQYEKFFLGMGVKTALGFKNTPTPIIQKRMGVVGVRIQLEFNGIPCITFEDVPPPKKMIGSSKGFGVPVTEKDELKEALTAYITRTAEKVREQKKAVASILVWVATDPFREDKPQYENSKTYTFPEATDYTPYLVAVGNRAMDLLYKPGFEYKRVGVLYPELTNAGEIQQNLYWRANIPKQKALMTALDGLNHKLGRGKIRMATEGFGHRWTTKFEFKSKGFSYDWNELPMVRVC